MKTWKTKQAYRDRAIQFVARVAREFDVSVESVTWMEAARFAYSCQSSWKPATWYLMRASLLHQMETEGTADALQAAEYLRTRSAHACRKVSSNTSARRLKNFGDDSVEELLAEVRKRRAQYSPLLELWIVFGRITGLRPHEWCHAELVDHIDVPTDPEEEGSAGDRGDSGDGDDLSDISTSATVKEHGTFLRVKNSKHTNGRGNGPYRHLDLSGLPPNVVEGLVAFAGQMSRLYERGEYESVYASVRSLLLRVNQTIHGGRRAKYLSLYSMRHRFSSIAKASVSLKEVAALMGHNSNRTAALHYGKRRHGSGGLDIKPRAAEVATVREKHSGWQPKAVASDTPDTPAAPSGQGEGS